MVTARVASFALFFCVLLVAAPMTVVSDSLPLLAGEFWVELEPAVGFEDVDTSEKEDQLRVLLEEARFIFSGMLYGFEFRYVPLDRRREVEEEFDIRPLAEIRWGDPRLKVAQSRYRNGRRYVLIRYEVTDEQASWARFWDSNVHAVSTAFGEGDLFEGQEQKLEAIRQGLKEAIRAYLRPREYNKPKEITGRAAFAAVPYVVIDQGRYRAKVEAKLDIRSVVPYKMF